ncbi:uncharacterized protein BX664DRAFT_313162 [Halteromyces radiatus]|uniref:uncharacterized protein n=1 Tax=Halteromyces radiatus TaxID=101107 RepID=UPI00221EAA32|nr:uncharacterized protein BX664DRAFT_313162 [Halteromyces radiatus]KAI8093072.1 hypothetical protein BX664DRAFT_313162 [Halteromyces radiatus]
MMVEDNTESVVDSEVVLSVEVAVDPTEVLVVIHIDVVVVASTVDDVAVEPFKVVDVVPVAFIVVVVVDDCVGAVVQSFHDESPHLNDDDNDDEVIDELGAYVEVSENVPVEVMVGFLVVVEDWHPPRPNNPLSQLSLDDDNDDDDNDDDVVDGVDVLMEVNEKVAVEVIVAFPVVVEGRHPPRPSNSLSQLSLDDEVAVDDINDDNDGDNDDVIDELSVDVMDELGVLVEVSKEVAVEVIVVFPVVVEGRHPPKPSSPLLQSSLDIDDDDDDGDEVIGELDILVEVTEEVAVEVVAVFPVVVVVVEGMHPPKPSSPLLQSSLDIDDDGDDGNEVTDELDILVEVTEEVAVEVVAVFLVVVVVVVVEGIHPPKPSSPLSQSSLDTDVDDENDDEVVVELGVVVEDREKVAVEVVVVFLVVDEGRHPPSPNNPLSQS